MGLDFERILRPPEKCFKRGTEFSDLRYFALAVACPTDKVFQIHRLVHHPVAIVELNKFSVTGFYCYFFVFGKK